MYDRGGTQSIGPLEPLVSVTWERLRDDISTATVTVERPSYECLTMLENVEPNRHELVIFRDEERVWEGPITLVTYGRSTVSLQARDVMHYANRTVDHHGHSNGNPNIVTVIQRSLNLLNDELVRKEALDPPVNVLPHVVAYQTVNDAKTSKITLPYQMTIFEDIDAMAARSGLDYTVVGRSIVLSDVHTRWAQGPQISEDDFIGEVIVSMYGMEHATTAFVTDGQGNVGTAGGLDAYYGEWEILDTAYDEASATDGQEPPSVAEMTSQAQRNLNGRNPVPTIVRVPDGSRLNPNGVLSMVHLVPGIRLPLVATLAGRKFSQMQKLDNVRVSEDGTSGEAITVTLSPAQYDDIVFEEE